MSGSVEQRLLALEAAVAGLLRREAEREAEHERARKQELRDSFRRNRHPLDLRNADPDDLTRWTAQVDRATRRPAA